jgi:hypothetical protein
VLILLDECLPKRLKLELAAYHARTVPEMGWAGVKNGKLLRLAEGMFDVFLTADRNLEPRQNITAFELGIIVLVAQSNDIDDLRLLIPQVREVLAKIKVGEFVRVGA